MPQSHTWQALYVRLITFKFQREARRSEQFGINLITLKLHRMPLSVDAPHGDERWDGQLEQRAGGDSIGYPSPSHGD